MPVQCRAIAGGRDLPTAGAVDERVARAAEDTGQAGSCAVTQEAVRPLGRAPLREQVGKLSPHKLVMLALCSEHLA